MMRAMAGTGEGNGNPLQYSCLENSMDRKAWWATVHGVAKSRTPLSDWARTFHFQRETLTVLTLCFRAESLSGWGWWMVRTWYTQHPGSVPLSENLVVEPQEGWKWKWKLISRVWLLATSWTAAYQAFLSMEFSRQEYWSGCHYLLHHSS